jgi:hypothetical protein
MKIEGKCNFRIPSSFARLLVGVERRRVYSGWYAVIVDDVTENTWLESLFISIESIEGMI